MSDDFYQTKGLKPLMIVLGVFVCTLALNDLTDSSKSKGAVIALLSLGAWYALRLSRTGVHVSAGGLKIVNPFRTLHVGWNDVIGFTWGRIGGVMPKVGVQLASGKVIGCFGLPVGGRGLGESSTGQAFEALNVHLAHHRPENKRAIDLSAATPFTPPPTDGAGQ